METQNLTEQLKDLATSIRQDITDFLEATDFAVRPVIEIDFMPSPTIGRHEMLAQVTVRTELEVTV